MTRYTFQSSYFERDFGLIFVLFYVSYKSSFVETEKQESTLNTLESTVVSVFFFHPCWTVLTCVGGLGFGYQDTVLRYAADVYTELVLLFAKVISHRSLF